MPMHVCWHEGVNMHTDRPRCWERDYELFGKWQQHCQLACLPPLNLSLQVTEVSFQDYQTRIYQTFRTLVPKSHVAILVCIFMTFKSKKVITKYTECINLIEFMSKALSFIPTINIRLQVLFPLNSWNFEYMKLNHYITKTTGNQLYF